MPVPDDFVTLEKGDPFQCALCGGEFIAARGSVETVAEAERNTGSFPDDPVVICDDCYQKYMRWFQAHRPDLDPKPKPTGDPGNGTQVV